MYSCSKHVRRREMKAENVMDNSHIHSSHIVGFHTAAHTFKWFTSRQWYLQLLRRLINNRGVPYYSSLSTRWPREANYKMQQPRYVLYDQEMTNLCCSYSIYRVQTFITERKLKRRCTERQKMKAEGRVCWIIHVNSLHIASSRCVPYKE